jgi:competence protein ComEC
VTRVSFAAHFPTRRMKRPLVPVALSYVAGILLAEFFHPPLAVLFFLSFAVLFTALAWSRPRMFLLCPLLVLVGWTNLTSRTTVLSPQDLRAVLGTNPALVTVRGALAETPSQRVFERDEQELWRSLAQVDVTALKEGTNWSPVMGRVMTSTTGQLPTEFFSGQPVEITGLLAPPAAPIAEGLFDYRAHLARQGIYFQLKVAATNAWRVASPAKTVPPLTDRFRGWAHRALALGLPVEDESLRLEQALTLGDKTVLTEEVSEPFVRAATYHIFAVDGLRMAIIFGIFFALFRVLGLSRACCGLVLLPVIWFYTALTGWPASAIRATVMLTVIIVGWALKRPSDLVNSLCAAAFIILVWEPQQLFQAGFQLSFLVVLSIILTMPAFDRIVTQLLQSDPLLPERLRPRWQRILHWPARFVLDFFFLSLAAWLGSIPLAAYYFHLFTPVSAPANLVAVPLCALVLVSDLISLLLAGWFPAGAEIFNHAGWFLMECIRVTSHWFAAWPRAYWYVAPPGLFSIGLYYAILLGVLTGRLFKSNWRVWKMAGLILLSLFWCGQWQREHAATRLTVLPLAGGSAVFVDAPGVKDDWLMDCGNTNAVQFMMKPFLRAHGVNRLPRLLLTHGDLRHVGGAELMEELFGVGEIFTSPLRFRSSTYRRIVAGLDDVPNRHRVIKRGDAVGIWRVLHPKLDEKFPQADDNSLVLLGDIHGTRVLLLSDLGRPGQEALMERAPDLRADLVVTGLPEQGEPLCEALLERLQPRVVMVADSEFPATKRSSPRLRERLERHDARVIYTRFSGAVTVKVGKSGWELRAMDGTQFTSETVKLQIPNLKLQENSNLQTREEER